MQPSIIRRRRVAWEYAQQRADLIYVETDVSRRSEWRAPQTRHRGFSAVKCRDTVGNRLLAALPAPDLDLLRPELETIALEPEAVLSRAGDEIEYVIFPHGGAITLMIDMADGHTVATAAVGREGAVGMLSVLGPSPAATTAVVRAAGAASRIPAPRFYSVFSRSPAVRRMVQNHVKAVLIQFQLGLACNALHPVEARMARWLLQLSDCVDHDELPLTQHALSQMLGVRRTTVTLLMRKLRARGGIRAERRGLIEVDRRRLAAAACECHRTMRREVEQIFSTDWDPSQAPVLRDHERTPGTKSGNVS